MVLILGVIRRRCLAETQKPQADSFETRRLTRTPARLDASANGSAPVAASILRECAGLPTGQFGQVISCSDKASPGSRDRSVPRFKMLELIGADRQVVSYRLDDAALDRAMETGTGDPSLMELESPGDLRFILIGETMASPDSGIVSTETSRHKCCSRKSVSGRHQSNGG